MSKSNRHSVAHAGRNTPGAQHQVAGCVERHALPHPLEPPLQG